MMQLECANRPTDRSGAVRQASVGKHLSDSRSQNSGPAPNAPAQALRLRTWAFLWCRAMSTTKRVRQRRGWRWITRATPAAIIEQHDDGWHVFVSKRDCGVFSSELAAEQFVNRLPRTNRQGSNDEQRSDSAGSNGLRPSPAC